MKHHQLPRVLRRAVGLMRFARESVGASSASMFLLEGQTLSGVVSEWDWTRTSFPTALRQWPSVARAVDDGAPLAIISPADAEGAELDWFEARGGIKSAACVPLRSSVRSGGVLFFDFDAADVQLSRAHASLLVDVGERCVRAFLRDAPPPIETAPRGRAIHVS